MKPNWLDAALWKDRSAWPADQEDYLFLARAIQEVAKAEQQTASPREAMNWAAWAIAKAGSHGDLSTILRVSGHFRSAGFTASRWARYTVGELEDLCATCIIQTDSDMAWVYVSEHDIRNLIRRRGADQAAAFEEPLSAEPALEGTVAGGSPVGEITTPTRPSYYKFAMHPERRRLAEQHARREAEKRPGGKFIVADQMRSMADQWELAFHQRVEAKVFASAYKRSHINRRKSSAA